MLDEQHSADQPSLSNMSLMMNIVDTEGTDGGTENDEKNHRRRDALLQPLYPGVHGTLKHDKPPLWISHCPKDKPYSNYKVKRKSEFF